MLNGCVPVMDITTESNKEFRKYIFDYGRLKRVLLVLKKFILYFGCKNKEATQLNIVLNESLVLQQIKNKFYIMLLPYKMIFYKYYYGFLYSEFIGYDFAHKSNKKCLSYISEYEK